MAAVAAGLVYEFLGKKVLGTTESSPSKTGLMDGEVAFHEHGDDHTTGPNRPAFLAWADRYIKARPSTGSEEKPASKP